MSELARLYRWETFSTRQDLAVMPEYNAVCVSGADKACLAKSPTCGHAEDADDWMRAHLRETGHVHFRRVFTDFAELLETDQLEPARVKRVRA
ncbi:hypothetical protein [Streptomyces sp. NPDC002855]|uniref:DUF7848 domain-containing protein n=1 Tax=Streptomyces sp. NPDC002855 TaxID=3154437 RepID=UPI0033256E27